MIAVGAAAGDVQRQVQLGRRRFNDWLGDGAQFAGAALACA
jgi:hypothetical protein